MLTAVIFISLAYALGMVMRGIGLPPLVGYLAAGFLLSSQGYSNNELLQEVAHAGVLMLLFAVGLKLHLKSLLQPEILAGSMLHMLVTVAVFGFVLSQMTSLSLELVIILSLAFSFSSTVVAAKVLESKRELRAFHGRVAIGILIVQDLVAVALLSYLGGSAPSPWALALLGLVVIKPILHRLLNMSGHGELVILFGLVMALLLGGKAFTYVGLSSELGALVLGMLFADHERAKELAKSIWGLKEILLVGFFLQIGLMGVPTMETLAHAAIINVALLFKAALFFAVLIMLRLRARSAFLAGLSLASFSEFGLIVISMAVDKGVLGSEWLVMLAVTVAISFAVSAPFNRKAHDLYEKYRDFLCRFETHKRHPDDEPVDLGGAAVMIMGMGRVGSGAYEEFISQGANVIGLDSDQRLVAWHQENGRNVLYADAEDPGFWSQLKLEGIDTVVLAIPELTAELIAIRQLKQAQFSGYISATARFSDNIDPLREAGADVIYDYYDGVGVGLARLTLEYDTEQAKSA